MPESLSPQPDTEVAAAWRAHREALHRFILRRVRDPAAAEDLVQDVLVKAYSRRGDLQAPSKLRAWMYQITRNAIVDHYRWKRPSEPIPEDLADEPGDDDGGAQAELARCLRPMVEALPEPYRQALTLAEFDHVSQRQMAAQLGLSFSGAKSRVQRARRMLQQSLLQCCRVELDARGGVTDYEVRDGCDRCAG